MAIPAAVQNPIVQTANGVILVSWDLSVGATSYDIQRSEDNVTYSALASVSGSPLATSYQDLAVTLGTAYYYKVFAVNSDGTSTGAYAGAAVPTPTGEMSLGAIRLASQQTADRVNSQFVTKQEWNSFINLASYELYDLLITVFEDYAVATPAQFTTDGQTYMYELPNGFTSYADGLNPNNTIIAKSFYKLLGVDLAVQSSSNGYVTVNKFGMIDRNRFVYPNTASTIYGVFNLQYRPLGNKLMFIPTPSANQAIRLWYIPRLTEMLADTDISDISISGWIRYVIVRAAKYALDKEESDTTKLDDELIYLKGRIEESAANRDAGQPDRISATRIDNNGWNGWGGGPNGNGSSGGF